VFPLQVTIEHTSSDVRKLIVAIVAVPVLSIRKLELALAPGLASILIGGVVVALR